MDIHSFFLPIFDEVFQQNQYISTYLVVGSQKLKIPNSEKIIQCYGKGPLPTLYNKIFFYSGVSQGTIVVENSKIRELCFENNLFRVRLYSTKNMSIRRCFINDNLQGFKRPIVHSALKMEKIVQLQKCLIVSTVTSKQLK